MLDYLKLDRESFNLKPCEIAGSACLLITPNDITVKWTKDTLNYRSVIVRVNDGAPISCGFPKFLNYGQSPDLYPDPALFTDWVVESKEDGSLICISQYKGQNIIRTRGVTDAFQHDSGPELKGLLEKYPYVLDNEWVENEKMTLLFEHCSVFNKIVINYPEPKLVLIGAVWHDTYEMIDAHSLDRMAKMMEVERPKKYEFKNLQEIIDNCETLKGMEGYVLSYQNFQQRVKLKGKHYLFLHKAKSEIGSFDKVLDLFLSSGVTAFEQFYFYVETHLDYELAEIAKPDMEEICRLNLLAHRELDNMREKIVALSGKTRKDAAMEIQKLYDENQRGLAFTMLSGKNIDTKQAKQLILRLKVKHDENNYHQGIKDDLIQNGN